MITKNKEFTSQTAIKKNMETLCNHIPTTPN